MIELKSNNAQTASLTGSILVLAPQPFFQNRGTPIAVKLLVEELALAGNDVHLLVFHEGEDVAISGVTIHRIKDIRWVNNIPPSISWKKIVCDVFMFFKLISLQRRYNFDVIHAVEESAFMAMVVRLFTGTPYIYDMDSSLAIQIVDKLSFLKPVRGFFEFFEKKAIRSSLGVVAVCKALEDLARSYAPDNTIVRLEDISLLDNSVTTDELLREKYQLLGPIMLYVGNLEGYQGIDLLMESFAEVVRGNVQGSLVIIGGAEKDIIKYKQLADQLSISDHTCFCGPRPVDQLGHFLKQADILLSPRTQGNNTPMKLYSYLDSGIPVLATNLSTHTQVLTDDFSVLVEPDKKSMAAGMKKLLSNPEKRATIGARGKQIAQKNYSLQSFRKKLNTFYTHIWTSLNQL